GIGSDSSTARVQRSSPWMADAVMAHASVPVSGQTIVWSAKPTGMPSGSMLNSKPVAVLQRSSAEVSSVSRPGPGANVRAYSQRCVSHQLGAEAHPEETTTASTMITAQAASASPAVTVSPIGCHQGRSIRRCSANGISRMTSFLPCQTVTFIAPATTSSAGRFVLDRTCERSSLRTLTSCAWSLSRWSCFLPRPCCRYWRQLDSVRSEPARRPVVALVAKDPEALRVGLVAHLLRQLGDQRDRLVVDLPRHLDGLPPLGDRVFVRLAVAEAVLAQAAALGVVALGAVATPAMGRVAAGQCDHGVGAAGALNRDFDHGFGSPRRAARNRSHASALTLPPMT